MPRSSISFKTYSFTVSEEEDAIIREVRHAGKWDSINAFLRSKALPPIVRDYKKLSTANAKPGGARRAGGER